MEYILSGRTIDFGAYSAYLATVRDRLPPHVAAFAADERHFSLNAPETLHDAWLVELVLREPATGERQEIRTTEVDVRFLGPFHDRDHLLRYTGVRRYELVGVSVARGHGDLFTHEVRLAADGVGLIHEYLFRGYPSGAESRLLVECADFTHEMLPRGRVKGRASLWEGVGLGIIVEWPSGVAFSNQTGGTSCLHPELEGVFVPLGNDCELSGGRLLSPETDLAAYFEGPKHRGTGATRGLDADDAGFIDAVLAKWRLGAVVTVDRSRLAESHEAWVHVRIRGYDPADTVSLFDFAPYPRRGVLTWTNSD